MVFKNLRTLFPASMVIILAIAANARPASAEAVRFDITDLQLGFFGQQFSVDYATDFAEIENKVITKTRMHLEFNTSGPIGGDLGDAANIAIDFQPPTINLPILQVSGADLGWQGQGQFTADFETDLLNEPFLDFGNPPPDLVLWFARIFSLDDANPALGGQFSNSFIEVELAPIPEPATFAMLSAGLLAISRRRRRIV
ncbi:MAG: PEP-CTERM sorting domain-containing protein [Phycisphaerales bacterium]|nr:PEP-CTERM sorting domain-containing protein [Phycisphaerales bacterium]